MELRDFRNDHAATLVEWPPEREMAGFIAATRQVGAKSGWPTTTDATGRFPPGG